MRPRWYIQKNLGDIQDLADAVDRADCLRTMVTVIPFDTKPHPIGNECCVLYGSTNFINCAYAAGQPTFFDKDTFTYEEYLVHWGSQMINNDCLITTIEEFAKKTHIANEEESFIRPNNDGKDFAGDVVCFKDFAAWYDRISHGGFTVVPDTKIVVATPKNIREEWRLWFVGGNYITGSRYRVQHRLSVSSGVPLYVLDFAKAAVSRWAPSPVFVLDVGLCGNEIGIVEANCFNSAGFYKADLDAIVGAVSDYVVKENGDPDCG